MEMEKIPQAGYSIEGLTIAGFNRSSLTKNITLPFKLIKSFIQVARIFKRFKPDAVIGVGGYSSFPVLRYAQSRALPTFIHESNSFAGKSNIMLGKKATMIFTAADGMEKFFSPGKIMMTGNPVRKSIAEQKLSKEAAASVFGLDPSRKIILSMGGSLGAKNINEAIYKDLSMFESGNVQLIWQTGKPFLQQAKQKVAGLKGIYVNDFITQMEHAYAAADIVISRSGAIATAELCVVKKPVIFVPYPYAAEDHQTANAKNLVKKNAALMITDKDAISKLVPSVMDLAVNEILQHELVNNIAKLGITNADMIIANKILETV
jgi:UDP-N-acetylglucosamine--N-acetylmuramyl-(pentapeptide) pyrophosphoryl-undecaprenol N-acetylglucosamine transferase